MPVGRHGTHLPRRLRPRADAHRHQPGDQPHPRRSSARRHRGRSAIMSATSVDNSDLYTDTITILTRAATMSGSDGAPDFADFLAHVLAATAANVGGPDKLVAGRPGSWESCNVDGLVRGTMGDRPDDWSWFRTQPVVIPLNVAELIEDELHHPGLMGLGEALENFDRRLDSLDNDCGMDAW